MKKNEVQSFKEKLPSTQLHKCVNGKMFFFFSYAHLINHILKFSIFLFTHMVKLIVSEKKNQSTGPNLDFQALGALPVRRTVH